MKKFIVTALIGATVLGMVSLTSCFKKNSDDAEHQCQHEYCDEIILTKPTCGKDGAQILICNDCAHSEIVKIPATKQHSCTKQQVIEPTCKDKGYSLYVCECGDVRKDDYVNETGHLYESKEILKNPTCTQNGKERLVCSFCNEEKIESIDKIDHSFNNGELIQSPTPEKEGTILYTCQVCGETESKSLPYSCTQGHVYEETIVEEPTCTSKGSKIYKCSVCQNTYFEDIDPLNHTYDQQVATNNYLVSDATCTTKAVYNYSCKCGDKGVETFEYGEALDHLYKIEISEDDGVHVKVCERDSSHTEVENCSGAEATCTNKAICEKCGVEYGAVKEHEYESNVIKDSTCSETGVKEFTCKDCDHSYQEELPVSEHDYKLVSEQEASCFQAKGSTYRCSVCEERYTTYTATNESVPEVTYRTFLHDETNLAYPDVGRTFTVIYPKTIVMEIGSKVDITFETDLTSEPIYELLYLNDARNYIEIQGTSIVAHTNTNKEQISLCLKFYHIENDWIFYVVNVEVINGHSYVEKSISKEPTCNETGRMLCECSVCGAIEYKDIPTVEHSYESVVTQNPTCCKEGVQTNTCTVCGDQIQTSIPKIYPQVEGVEVKIDTDMSKVYKLSELKEIFGDLWTHVQILGTPGKCCFRCSKCEETILLTYTED